MSAVGDFVARITAQAGSFATVSKAWTLKPVENLDATMPAAYVYLAGIESEGSQFFEDSIQAQIVRIGVLVVCSADDLETRRGEIQSALIGWEPETGADLVEHEGGAINDIVGGVAWWGETFAYRRWVRGA